MLRSLYSGISGLRSHQTMLDVTGNNIANVNTTGFKASSVQFQDTLSQMTQGAGGPQAQAGGTNPAQVGLGVQVAGISTNFTQGSSQATGKATDMMISGDGFFVTTKGGEQLYTRAGAFELDSTGRLVSPDGAILQGWMAANGQIPVGGPVGPIDLSPEAISEAKATTEAEVSGNLPSEAAVNDRLVRDVEIYTADGTRSTLSLTFQRTAAGWDVKHTNSANTEVTIGQLEFTDGKMTLPTAPVAPFDADGIDIDISALTGYAGMTTVGFESQDGRAAGALESFTMANDGTLMGSFSNGQQAVVGRIALANFTNPGGLEKAGSSSYRATANSGQVELGTAGTGGLGTLAGGSLEMSNVDLSQEFTNLIVAQRGFQANARIITTSDEVLQELTNLKR
ncbi:flagellar hook protein FlgE [Arthrobacter sulfonylureivorans]|uniref:Flagellar hook protein FlgE n=1 Tax=Arthrobacter sulfonylureivorans TaxID=2486855 RepID=A0ABY3WE15_9MICC|nr:flagellar hook protein FlgE [Arthrobacter sulfonylureivorans]UNK46808.1 flagellar hook protein FlgE [Arthrobacter sulfonylureivorans]